ncbi:hypothetical protein ACIBH1_06860 [Nonomuraea sp. NPDC050663]|uniref:hypothetical protein n=1 Tax=Nonomuraea sp. NPDC050663 TaxID=3364370 RepID=UPI00379C575C
MRDRAALLMRAAGPYALVVLGLDVAAVLQARGNLAGVQVGHPAGPVAAMEEFGVQRSLVIAAVQAGFAIFFLWAARRRSPAALAATGVVTGLYWAGLLLVRWFNPISDFPMGGFSSPPFERLEPGWYLPSLTFVLWAAAVTQLAAVALAMREGSWQEGGRGSRLLVAGPILAVAAYAVVNLVAIRLATEPRTPTDVFGAPWNDSSRSWLVRRAWESAGLLGRWLLLIGATALPVVALGWRMRRRGVTPGRLVPAWLFSAPYLLVLALFTWLHPMSGEMNYDDQAGYIYQNPPWHPVALVVVCVAAVAVQVVALVRATPRAGGG